MVGFHVSKLPRIDQGRLTPSLASDFLSTSNPQVPFNQTLIASGTISTPNAGTITANHPGVVRITSSTTTNSGAYIGTNTGQILLGGGERYEAIFHIPTLTDTTIRLGFLDTATSSDSTDGAYIEITATTGAVTGKTATNGTRSSTGTSGTVVASTWYRAQVDVNASATLVTYRLYSDAGALLWSNTLSTNIPTTSGRECGAAVVATNVGTVAVDILNLDYMSFSVFRTLTRGGA